MRNFNSIIFFASLSLVGIINFKNYGISWEAPGLRLNGGNAAIYIADKLHLHIIPEYYRQFPAMGHNSMADHGVAYDLPLVITERLLGFQDTLQVYQFRTFINFCVFILGTFAVYQISKRYFCSSNLALLSVIFYVLSPRIFAAGFYSPSDMIFTSFLAVSVNYGIKFIQDGRIKNAITAGIISGYATDIRLLGVIVFPIILLGFLINYRENIRFYAKSIILYISSGLIAIYLFFPYFWASPINHFVQVFKSLSKYNWGGTNLYFGQTISASKIPWHYIPVWISITTPVVYLILFLVGFLFICFSFKNFKVIDFKQTQKMVFMLLVLLPILSVILFRSVLYDSWRHLFFVYPYVIVIATIGWNSIKIKTFHHFLKVKIFITFICLLQIGIWMYLNNPYQYLYFNQFAGSKNLQYKWEMDYLGLSNKDGMQYILDRDGRKKITIGIGSFTPFDMSTKVIPEQYRSRLSFISVKKRPDYIVNNFRSPPKTLKEDLVGYSLFKKFTIGSSSYLEIWKLEGRGS